MKKSLFIFRRDLRLQDNTGLLAALKDSDAVIPCFIFDPRQVRSHPYRSESAFAFMLESLRDLDKQLKKKNAFLYCFEGKAHKVVEQLIKSQDIYAVYVNKDYTPFSLARDKAIEHVCQNGRTSFHSFDDCLLNPPDAVRKNDGGVYTVYSPYMRKALSHEIPRPQANRYSHYDHQHIPNPCMCNRSQFGIRKSKNRQPGGRMNGIKILRKMNTFKNYDALRNFPDLDATTHVSAHLKFGTCSVREVFHAVRSAFGLEHTLIKELIWRDFFTQVGYHFPRVLGHAFREKYDNINWVNDKRHFNAWCDGLTGFPLVDAGMRELNETGFMHNRVRMITASFLVKDLRVDWRWGERYFARRLVDYDPLVNNGNWQWVASTGCDAQPYFRIFNPWLQQKRYDDQCQYVKKWVPVLKPLSPKDIHQYGVNQINIPLYPRPIINRINKKINSDRH